MRKGEGGNEAEIVITFRYIKLHLPLRKKKEANDAYARYLRQVASNQLQPLINGIAQSKSM